MENTYKGILMDDHIEWNQQKPRQNKPLEVMVTVMEKKGSNDERGKRMAEALHNIARRNPFGEIDASKWQHHVRKDRPLPNRSR